MNFEIEECREELIEATTILYMMAKTKLNTCFENKVMNLSFEDLIKRHVKTIRAYLRLKEKNFVLKKEISLLAQMIDGLNNYKNKF